MTTWGRRWTPESAEALRRRRSGGEPPAAVRAPSIDPQDALNRRHTRALAAVIDGPPAQPQTSGKYGGNVTYVDGHRFPSKLEARLYTRLSVLKAEGRIVGFLRQVPFHLPGGRKYTADFLVHTYSPAHPLRVLDTKGFLTDRADLAISVVEGLYPWPIELVKGRLADTWEPESEPSVNTTRGCARARTRAGERDR